MAAIVDEEIAYAKINLALHVRRRQPSGYHDIETLFAFVSDGDRLTVSPADRLSLQVTGPFGHGLDSADNLVTRAAQLLGASQQGKNGAAIRLDKRLPVASGIGGGSADAAATLRLLNRYWRLGLTVEQLAELSKPLGADVPACVLAQTCFGTGTGQALQPGECGVEGKPVLLVNPGLPVSTKEVFDNWDGVDRGPLSGDDPWASAQNGRNDLEAPAIALVPQIRDILQLLDSTGPLLARMSGSGATCFAIYDGTDAAAAAGRNVREKLPGAWTMQGTIR